MNRILITGNLYNQMEVILKKEQLPYEWRFKHEEDVTKADLLWADVFVGFRPTSQFEFGNMKWVHCLGAGVDSFLDNRKWQDDVLLTRTVCSFGERIAEYCISYMLASLQHHAHFNKLKHEKHWGIQAPIMLKTQHVVIYGTGEIGQKLASALSIFGVNVTGVSRSGQDKPYFKQVFTSHDKVHLAQTDWVINTLPLTEATYHLFDQAFFQQLNGASFINVGRGKCVDEQALLLALEQNRITQAVLDVFETEPLPVQSPLWTQPNVTITPHISAVTTPEEAVSCFLETLTNIENNKPCPNKVDTDSGY